MSNEACTASDALEVDWVALGLHPSMVIGYEILQHEKRRSVYRVHIDRVDIPSLVLKRSPVDEAAREATFYRQVLPQLGDIPALRLYGACEGGERNQTWLLMEDAGSDLFDWRRSDHRRLAGSWLGRYQRLGIDTDLSGVLLRDRGPTHFSDHVTQGRRAVEENLGNPVLTAADVALLTSLLERLRVVEEMWPSLEAACSQLPQTLVHGDFKPDNLRIRATERGADLVVFDWNEAGFGLPALDLSRFLRSDMSDRPKLQIDEEITRWIHPMAPDLDTYLATVNPIWPHLDARDVRWMGYIGELFRCVASTRWQAVRLEYAWVEGPMADLRCFHEWLGTLLRVIGWC